jgi:AraC family transcriptional activator of pyochelin receptor
MSLTERSVHGLRLTHAVAEYTDSAPRRGTSEETVVRLHFSLRGSYAVRYPALERRYDRLGPHFSLFFASPFELEFVNESPLIETFGMAIPVAQFASYAAGAGADVARFCERALSGRAGMLYEPSASRPAVLEHGIRRMLEAKYEGALEELQGLKKTVEA